jgi:hypothetical protein
MTRGLCPAQMPGILLAKKLRRGLGIMGVSDFLPALPEPLRDLELKLDRDIDRIGRCCENRAAIHAGKEPHGGELRCSHCDRHRGWLSKTTANFLAGVIERFGQPATPPTITTNKREAEKRKWRRLYGGDTSQGVI